MTSDQKIAAHRFKNTDGLTLMFDYSQFNHVSLCFVCHQDHFGRFVFLVVF